jgi:hypothetical protein
MSKGRQDFFFLCFSMGVPYKCLWFSAGLKAAYSASMYKELGNLCYVIGALQAFMSHENRDFRMRVRIPVCITPNFNCSRSWEYFVRFWCQATKAFMSCWSCFCSLLHMLLVSDHPTCYFSVVGAARQRHVVRIQHQICRSAKKLTSTQF